jgi:hypothetical protein
LLEFINRLCVGAAGQSHFGQAWSEHAVQGEINVIFAWIRWIFVLSAIVPICVSCGGGGGNLTITIQHTIATGHFKYDKEYIFTPQATSYIAQVTGKRTLTTDYAPQCRDYNVLFGQDGNDRMHLTVVFRPGLIPGDTVTLDINHTIKEGPQAHHWSLPLRNNDPTNVLSMITYNFQKWVPAGAGTALDVSFWKTEHGEAGIGGDKTIAGTYVLSSLPQKTLDAKMTWDVTGTMAGNLLKYCD